MKNSIIGIIAGGIVFLIGASLHDHFDATVLGNLLAFSGIGIASIFILSLTYRFVSQAKHQALKDKIQKYIGNKSHARTKKKTEDELLRYRELYDKEILTKEEFEAKVSELKDKIL